MNEFEVHDALYLKLRNSWPLAGTVVWALEQGQYDNKVKCIKM